jgi:hypothetical protein
VLETACLSTAAADALRAAPTALRIRFIHVLNLTPGRWCQQNRARIGQFALLLHSDDAVKLDWLLQMDTQRPGVAL